MDCGELVTVGDRAVGVGDAVWGVSVKCGSVMELGITCMTEGKVDVVLTGFGIE